MLSYLSMNLFATFAFLLPGHPTLSTTFDYLKQQKTAEKIDTNAQWFHCSWSILLKRVNIRVRGFHLFLFLFFFYLALHRSISLYLLQLNLTRFLFTCLFAVFSTLVPYLWSRPSRSGHGRPPVECRIQEARLFFFVSCPFLKITTYSVAPAVLFCFFPHLASVWLLSLHGP